MGFHRPHKRVSIDCGGESRTKQQFAKECDINNILKQFRKTGMITHVAKQQGYYGDFIGAGTYHDALNLIQDAQDMFMTLPSQIRAEFDNDPAKFLEFVHNPDNEEKMREMGLLQKVPQAAPEPPPAKIPPEPKASKEAVSEAIQPASE